MDLRNVLNTLTRSVHSVESSAKRKAPPPSVEKPNKHAKPKESSSVYLLMSRSSGIKMESTEYDVQGIYSCLATAINRARRMVKEATDDESFEEPSEISTSKNPFSASWWPDKYTESEVWVEIYTIDDTIEEEELSEETEGETGTEEEEEYDE